MLTRIALALLILFTYSAQASSRELIDMAGDEVALPEYVERVATVGAVPVLNSLLFAIGAGKRIVNGLPEFARKPRFGYQEIFAPQMADLPSLQNADNSPKLEDVLRVAPTIVLTMDRPGGESLRQAGQSALFVAWRHPEDIKIAVRLLGQVFDRAPAAERYVTFFDATLARVATGLKYAPAVRPRVLYFSPRTLTQPHLVAEWWIRQAGGESVTEDGRSMESRSFTMEQLLAWDPDIVIVPVREDVEVVMRDPRFAELKAVRARQVLSPPCGAHVWSQRTSEQPLTLLWAAKQFHPTLFADVDLVDESRHFYQDFFEVALSAAQIQEILSGGPRDKPIGR
jgi:iron complex transport system substrate-binding protein